MWIGLRGELVRIGGGTPPDAEGVADATPVPEAEVAALIIPGETSGEEVYCCWDD